MLSYLSNMDKIERLQEIFDDSNKIVFFTGAGVSTEVEIIEHNGVTLKQEIEIIEKEIRRLALEVAEMENLLSKLDGIEYKLYYEIVVNNKKVSEAISYVADKCFTSERNVWKTYYPKIKDDIYTIKKAKKYSESSVK